MLNFTAIVEDGEPVPGSEIDEWKWFDVERARAYGAKRESLAQIFLDGFFRGEYRF
jgi:NADH pyrophosphatase NudC (nudix superfamily)